MKLNEPTPHKTQMEIFHELVGHQPEFLVSLSTPAPVCEPAGHEFPVMLGLFLDRFEPFAEPRASKLIWTFGCN